MAYFVSIQDMIFLQKKPNRLPIWLNLGYDLAAKKCTINGLFWPQFGVRLACQKGPNKWPVLALIRGRTCMPASFVIKSW